MRRDLSAHVDDKRWGNRMCKYRNGTKPSDSLRLRVPGKNISPNNTIMTENIIYHNIVK